MRFAPLRVEHLAALELQAGQAYMGGDISAPGYAEQLLQGQAFTAIAGGEVIGCAGCIEPWDNRGILWALVSANAGRHMTAIHRAAVGFLAQSKLRRIETFVDTEFAAGHRWVQMLGFEREGRMRAFSPDGRDFDLYARVK